MHRSLPPIYRDCRSLLVHTEEMVRCFSRYHKYTLGTDLRQQAMAIMRTVHRLVFDKAQQKEHLNNLIWLVDDYKLSLQLGMELESNL
ncbi:four helix bundle protein [Trichlorobacter lovleyi]|uniref:four helix bundle protein n=1 Tax=Trichlorobacter lovleyi TaxID=313985 RepID=UPI003D0FF000